MNLRTVAVLRNHKGTFPDVRVLHMAAGFLKAILRFQNRVHSDADELVMEVLGNDERFAASVNMDEVGVSQQAGSFLQGNVVKRVPGGFDGAHRKIVKALCNLLTVGIRLNGNVHGDLPVVLRKQAQFGSKLDFELCKAFCTQLFAQPDDGSLRSKAGGRQIVQRKIGHDTRMLLNKLDDFLFRCGKSGFVGKSFDNHDSPSCTQNIFFISLLRICLKVKITR